MDFLRCLERAKTTYMILNSIKQGKRKFCKKVLNADTPSLELKYLVRHLKSRLTNLHERTERIKYIIDMSEEAFSTRAEHTLTLESNRLNDTMKLFSAVAVIFMPLQTLAGLLGMNILVPYQNYKGTTPFWVLVAISLCFILVCLVLFKRLNWA